MNSENAEIWQHTESHCFWGLAYQAQPHIQECHVHHLHLPRPKRKLLAHDYYASLNHWLGKPWGRSPSMQCTCNPMNKSASRYIHARTGNTDLLVWLPCWTSLTRFNTVALDLSLEKTNWLATDNIRETSNHMVTWCFFAFSPWGAISIVIFVLLSIATAYRENICKLS